QAEHAIDFLAVAYIASHRERVLDVSDAGARGFRSPGIAGKQDDSRSLVGEHLGNRFSDAHGGTRNDSNFSREFCSRGSHAVLLSFLFAQVKRRMRIVKNMQ